MHYTQCFDCPCRDTFCFNDHFDLSILDDISVIITFYNEHLSALLRSIHSILNRTPPPLLREILLVDDHSNTTDLMPGGMIYKIIQTLPKVKLVRNRSFFNNVYISETNEIP